MRTIAIAAMTILACGGPGDRPPPPPPPTGSAVAAAPVEPPPGESTLLADFALASDKPTASSPSIVDGEPPPSIVDGEPPPSIVDAKPPPSTVDGQAAARDIAAVLAHDKVAALSIAVLDGDAIGARAFGVLARGQPTPATDETRFEAGAIAQPVTAVAVLRLVAQHRLDLDADIAAYLKSYRPPRAGLTLRALLSHTAGLDSPDTAVYVHADGALAGYPPGKPLPTAAQLLAGKSPALSAPVGMLAAPNTFASSTGGYTIVQQVIEDVTGQPFADAMRDLVLAPAGMASSTFADAPGGNDYARGHDRTGAPLPTMTGYYAIAEKAASGLWTTPRDLARFAREVVRAANGEPNALLADRALATAMLAPIADAGPAGDSALGWFVPHPGADRWFTRSGRTPGFHAMVMADWTARKALVVMANTDAEAPAFALAVDGIARLARWRVPH